MEVVIHTSEGKSWRFSYQRENIDIVQLLEHKEADKTKFKMSIHTSQNKIIDPFVDFIKNSKVFSEHKIDKIELKGTKKTTTIFMKDTREAETDFIAVYEKRENKVKIQGYIERIE